MNKTQAMEFSMALARLMQRYNLDVCTTSRFGQVIFLDRKGEQMISFEDISNGEVTELVVTE